MNEGNVTAKHSARRDVRYVYAAGPIRLRRHRALHRRRLDQIRARYPQATIVDALSEYDGLWDWQERWPLMIPDLDVLVFMTDTEGCVGAGTLKEVLDAVVHRVAVELVADTGFVPFAGVSLHARPDANAWQVMTVEISAA